MSAEIFISFASQDRRVALTLCAALENRGFKCWISSRDILPGENFQSAIVKAIRNSKIMLLVFTANSNNSEEMNKELALASQSKLMVVPLRIEDVTPNDAFAYEFATRQWIDFFADWELAIQQLSDRIEAATRATNAAQAAQEPVVEAAPAEESVPAPEAPAAEPAEAAEPRSFAAESDADEAGPADAEPAAEDIVPAGGRSRRAMYLVLTALVAVAALIGFTVPGLMHSKSPAAQTRAMQVMRAAPAPADVQRISVEAPPAPETPPEAPKAAPKHKKAAAKVEDNDVPY